MTLAPKPPHGADVVRRELVRAFTGDQHGAPVGIGHCDAERSWRRPAD